MNKKRFLTVLGIALGSLLALLLLLYLARRPLFESTIVARVQTTLARMLRADIEISGIGGNWLSEFIVEGVDIRGKEGSAYEEILGIELTVQLSLFAVISGDLSGLQLARVKAKQVVLNCDGLFYSGPEAFPKQEDPSGSWRDLLTMFEHGVTIEIEKLLLKPDYVAPGPLRITLEPGKNRRDVHIEAGETKIVAHIDRQGRYGIDLSGNQSGRLLRALGVVKRATDPGRIVAKLTGQTSPQRVALELDLDARLESGAAIGSHCKLELRDGRLIAEKLEVDLPGVFLVGRNLDVPVAQLSNKELSEVLQHQGTGRLSVKITNLDSYRTLLPDLVLSLLPITGDISLDVQKGVVQLQPSLLHAKGFDLRIAAGSFSLVDLEEISLQQLRNATATGLEIELTAQDSVTIELGTAGSLSWAGRIDAKLSGTVFDPSIDADLSLRDLSFAGHEVAKIDCRISYAGGTLSIDGLDLKDAMRDTQLLVRTLKGKASLRLPRTGSDVVHVDLLDLQFDRPDIAGRIVLDSLYFGGFGGTAGKREIVLSGQVDLTKIDPLLFEPGVRDYVPQPPFMMQLRASARGDTFDVEVLKLTWGTKSSRLIALDAKGPVPFRWAPGASLVSRQVKEAFTANLHFVDVEPIPGQPAVEIRAVVSVDAKEFRIPSFEARAANGFVRGEKFLLGVSLVDLLSGEASLSSATIAGKLVVHEYVFGNVVSQLLVDTEVRGLINGEVTLGGTVARPDIEGKLHVESGHLKRKGLPGMQNIRIDSSFAENRIVIDYKADIRGTPIEVSAKLESGAVSIWDADEKSPLRAVVTFTDVPLRMLPKQWTRVSDLSGVVGGKFSISGSWDDLRPTLALDLKNVSCKLRSLPRIDKLHVKIVADRSKCTINATGDLGAAPLTVNATWIAGKGAFPAGFLTGKVDATIHGNNVLLVRTGGLKVRGNVDLTANGPLDKIAVRGTIMVSNSKYIKRLSLVPDLKMKSGTTSSDIFGPWSFPGGERFDFDIRLETMEPVTVATNILDTKVDVGCNLVGQGSALHLEGACVSRTGKLRFPGMSMRLNSVRFVFSKTNPTRPDIFVTAQGQRHGIRIRLQAKGPWDEPVVTLTSTPALQAKELWALAATGVRPNSLARNDARANTSIIVTYVLQEALLSYFASESTEASESFVSRFTFQFGNEISRRGEETWQVDFDIGGLWVVPPNFGLRAERDVYEDLNMGLVYRWRF